MILAGRDGPVATVALDRPERMNALNLAMWERLGAAFADLAADPAVRAVVLRGSGTAAFASGADIGEFAAARAAAEAARIYDSTMRRALEAVRTCPKPVVALIFGPCIGAGLALACCCDLRIAAHSGRFGAPVGRIGVAMPLPEVALVRRIAGPAVTAELLLEGRVINAAEALSKGLLTRVAEDAEAEAYAAARRIAQAAPLSNALHKRFIARLDDPAPWSEAEAEECHAILDTRDHAEGLAAFLAKRKPVFTGE
jgi:enoyl-CoA hydratase/carnithine racemase